MRKSSAATAYGLLMGSVILPAYAQTNWTPAQLTERAIERRAVEAVIWGMPAVNFDLLYQAMAQAKGDWNQVVYWSRLPDWKNQTLTPNPDVIYLMPFFDTKDVGPMVMEIPPAGPDGSITGSIDDAWQTAMEDVGPAGVDKGKGGKYLILPPGYKDKTPDGYIALQSPTYRSYALLRSNLASGSEADVAKAVAYGKRVKVYPLSQARNPPPTTFVDAIDVVYDSTIPYDLRFFQSLDRFVQHEPWIERDKAMIDMLKSIGIEKGKTFDPDQKTQGILNEAAARGARLARQPLRSRLHDLLQRRNAVGASGHAGSRRRHDDQFRRSGCLSGRRTRRRLFDGLLQRQASGRRPVLPDDDPRQGSQAVRRQRHLPADRARERAGKTLLVGHRLRPRHARADPGHAVFEPRLHHARPRRRTRTVRWTSISAPRRRPARRPTGCRPTPSGKFEVLFRLYGPEKPFFDKSWVLPDIEKIQ